MNHYPLNLTYKNEIPYATIFPLPDRVFDVPFMTTGIEQHWNVPGNKTGKVIRIDKYKEYIESFDFQPPTAFIFHQSRCGSTLVCQMLKQLEGSRVISEPKIFSIYARAIYYENNKLSDPNTLKTLVNSLSIAQKPIKYIFIKPNSWTIEVLPEITKIFPNVPWLYLGRDPIEITVSNLQKRASMATLNKQDPAIISEILNLTKEEVLNLEVEELLVLLLKRNMEISLPILGNHKSNGLFIKYTEIKNVFFSKILPHLNIVPTPEESAKIIESSQYYSKYKDSNQAIYKDDSASKRKSASKELLDLIEKHRLIETYTKLLHAEGV